MTPAPATLARFEGRRALVTGGAGFIGSSLAIRLVEEGAEVTVADAMLPEYGGNLFNLEPVRDRVRVNCVETSWMLGPLVQGYMDMMARDRGVTAADVVGLSLEESEKLLDEVWSHVETAVYKHKWALGDLVLWDNRTTMHRRDAFDPKSRRVMHRTQIKGSGAPARAAL